MAKYCLIGKSGLIGSELAKRLVDFDTTPNPENKYLFYLGGCVHPEFEKNPDYWEQKTLNDFHYLLNYCAEHNIKFIYASSALVYEKDTRFAQHKKELERLAQEYPNTLGLRIFPVYGNGDHNTFITLSIKDIKNGVSPKVFSNGNQSRSFIHVEDVVNQIMMCLDKTGIVDIAGVLITFNEIIAIINKHLGTDVKPEYIEAPEGYSQEGVSSKNPLPLIKSIDERIKQIILG